MEWFFIFFRSSKFFMDIQLSFVVKVHDFLSRTDLVGGSPPPPPPAQYIFFYQVYFMFLIVGPLPPKTLAPISQPRLDNLQDPFQNIEAREIQVQAQNWSCICIVVLFFGKNLSTISCAMHQILKIIKHIFALMNK